MLNCSGGCLENKVDNLEFRCIPFASSERATCEPRCRLPGFTRGIVLTAFVCFLGFRSEITATLSDDMTGSITVQDQATKAEVKNLVAHH